MDTKERHDQARAIVWNADYEYRTGNKALGHALSRIALQHELEAIAAISPGPSS